MFCFYGCLFFNEKLFQAFYCRKCSTICQPVNDRNRLANYVIAMPEAQHLRSITQNIRFINRCINLFNIAQKNNTSSLKLKMYFIRMKLKIISIY